MNVLIGVVLGGLLLAILERNHIGIVATVTSGSGSAPGLITPPPLGGYGQIAVGGSMVDDIGTHEGLQLAGNALNAVPVVGPALSQAFDAIAGGLLKAHEQRKREAVDENSASAKGVAQVDQAIAAAFNNLNAGRITPAQAAYLLDQGWAQYWGIVGNHIQPGRNGCQNGTALPAYTGGGVGSLQSIAYTGCSANNPQQYGAACCIGMTLKAAIANAKWALVNRGRAAPIPKIYANKYGFPGRANYTVVYNS
jgi:hypothetical protein